MKRKVSITICRSLALVMALIFAGSAFAAEFTAFGPVVFERQKGKPGAETLAFPEPAFGRDFMMTITNGDERGKNRVSAADVMLNGNRIAGPSDFNRTVDKIVRPVSLNTVNTLSALVEGAPGGFITVVVTGTSYEPTVTAFTVFPQTIRAGESAELSWRTVNAEVCSIAPGVGEVPGNGSMAVTPSETTTYTLTATNASGTAAAETTIEVIQPPPTVSLSAAPESVRPDEPVTLTWHSSHAESATIEPGIGPVETEGSIVLYPKETTVYTITVTGPGGTASADATATVVSPISLHVTSPAEDETVQCPGIMVRGTVTNATGNETMVIVNDIPAILIGDEFVANHVPVPEGESEVDILAGDAAGNSLETAFTVYREPSDHYFLLLPDSATGLSPFETDLAIQTSLDLASVDFQDAGPGLVEITENGPRQYRLSIREAGTYFLTANAWDSAGNLHTDTVALRIMDTATLDAMLREKWEGMKTSLAAGDVQGAMAYFTYPSQEKYTKIFTAIGENLPEFVANMEEIGNVYMRDRVAKYRIKKNQEVNGQIHKITYYIYFVRAFNGFWYIESF